MGRAETGVEWGGRRKAKNKLPANIPLRCFKRPQANQAKHACSISSHLSATANQKALYVNIGGNWIAFTITFFYHLLSEMPRKLEFCWLLGSFAMECAVKFDFPLINGNKTYLKANRIQDDSKRHRQRTCRTCQQIPAPLVDFVKSRSRQNLDSLLKRVLVILHLWIC